MNCMKQAKDWKHPELLAAASVICLLLLATAAHTLPTLGRGSLDEAALDVHVMLQLARVEAVSRNRNCHLIVDRSARSLRVLDGHGTPALDDDELLHEKTLPLSIGLDLPGDSDSRQVTFRPSGGPTPGSVIVSTDGHRRRISVDGGGRLSIGPERPI